MQIVPDLNLNFQSLENFLDNPNNFKKHQEEEKEDIENDDDDDYKNQILKNLNLF